MKRYAVYEEAQFFIGIKERIFYLALCRCLKSSSSRRIAARAGPLLQVFYPEDSGPVMGELADPCAR